MSERLTGLEELVFWQSSHSTARRTASRSWIASHTRRSAPVVQEMEGPARLRVYWDRVLITLGVLHSP
jgi:hypothetical protein